jgi:hypothetical protein
MPLVKQIEAEAKEKELLDTLNVQRSHWDEAGMGVMDGTVWWARLVVGMTGVERDKLRLTDGEVWQGEMYMYKEPWSVRRDECCRLC